MGSKSVLSCVVLLPFVVCAIAAYTEQDYQSAFTEWQHTYQKSYLSGDFAAVYATFKGHMDFIADHNTRGLSWTVALNEFADLTPAQFSALLLHVIPPLDPATPEHNADGHAKRTTPASVDWRTQGAVNAIKNQGQCGSCWTFGSAAAMEGIYKISTGTLVSLSEQNLLDCTPSQAGCNGGNPQSAMQYVINNKGIDTESAYPYTGVQGNCSYNAANLGATITGTVRVTSGSESALLTAVAQQPVTVAIDASLQSFQLYKSGVYNDTACSNTTLDHAVTAIGYGTNTTGDYWLVRNSWGTSWGMQGYFELARNCGNRCGIATQAVYPTRTSTTSAAAATTGAVKAATTTTTAKAATTTGKVSTTTSSHSTTGSRTNW